MSTFVLINDEKIKVEDMFLDFVLTATVINSQDQIDFTGKETFSIGAYKEGQLFGITSIEIDIALNQQPQIDITFKDAYGNTALRTEPSTKYKYRRLFELPPPKFTLTFKGFLGKPISYLLQIRSTSVSYNPGDGTFEIKAKFVPNIFGFYGDIPYKYLWSVDRLRSGANASQNRLTILQIVQNGQAFNETIQNVGKNYQDIEDKINALLLDGQDLYDKFNSGVFSDSKGAEAGSREARRLVKIESNDPALVEAGFKNIEFNINYIGPSGGAYAVRETDQKFYGTAIKASIITPSNSDLIDLGANNPNWGKNAEALLKKKIDEITKILEDNLAAITQATQLGVGTSVQKSVIDSQTIKSVMSVLSSDAAFILGYIIEGGLKGYANAPKDSRETGQKSIGLYYPLAYKNDEDNNELYDQVPDSEATIEMSYVKDFMRAQFEGIQVAEQYAQELEEKQSGINGAIGTGALIKKRLTNAEVAKPNPYTDQNNIDMFCVNVLQRCGLMSTRMTGAFSIDASQNPLYDKSPLRDKISLSEYENMIDQVKKFRGTQKEQLRSFCKAITTFYKTDGSFNKNFTDQFEGVTYQQYFTKYFEMMKSAGLSNDMFFEKRADSLYCYYFINNGVLYYNEKKIYDVLEKLLPGRDANNTLRGFGNGDLLMYIKPENVPTEPPPDALVGTSADKTAAYSSGFYKFQKVDDDIVDYWDSETFFLDYEKITEGRFYNAEDLIIRRYEYEKDGVKKFEEGSYFAFYANISNAKVDNLMPYVLNLNDKYTGSILFFICSKILSDTAGTDAEADKKKAAEDKKKQENDPNAVESPAKETYEFDKRLFDSVYHQFHHICNSWMSIILETAGGRDQAIQLAKDRKLANFIYDLYSNDSNTGKKYNITYIYPLATTLDGNMEEKYPVANSIIKTDILMDMNVETSVFNMMSQLCEQNNFLLQSIPGGAPKRNVTDQEVIELFTPSTPKEMREPQGNNSLCVIWTPTPENRSFGNNGNELYDYESFKKGLNKLKSKIPLFEFGSPNNIVVKSIKATTDDNKVTSESILAVDEILKSQNDNKKKTMDCSMLSVMQGRSYRLNMDIIGNASFIPTQLFSVGNLPIFTGLYWATRVRHSITPNNMETSVEAMKMKFDGTDKFFAVKPITSNNFIPLVSVGAPSSEGSEFPGNGSLNVGFLKRVKDVKLTNANDINNLIQKYVGDPDFPTFFNNKIKGKNSLLQEKIDTKQWEDTWNAIIRHEWTNYGESGINFLEFLVMNMVIYKETGGSFSQKSEIVNSVNASSQPGIAYAFDATSKKASYNKSPNKTAFTLFNDPQFIDAHKALPYGNDPKVLRTKNNAWNGNRFPVELFSNKSEAVRPNPPTFINEADFFKFRGRGYIQTTWRSSYEKIVKKILAYSGNDATIIKYRNLWKGQPYNGNNDTILTRSKNSDWDELFNNSYTINAWSMKSHADNCGDYQYITDLTKTKEFLTNRIISIGKKINGDLTGEYSRKILNTVNVVLDTMSPDTAEKDTVTTQVSNSKDVKPFDDFLDFTKFSYPLSTNKVVSPVGYRNIGGSQQFHNGVDFASSIGNPIYSICKGKVIQVGGSGYGPNALYVEIDKTCYKNPSGTKFYIWYGHNDNNLVSAGADIEKGQLIATVGNKGKSEGPHLHLEIGSAGKAIVLDLNKYTGTRDQINKGPIQIIAKQPFKPIV